MGLTADQPPAQTNGEESIPKLNTLRTTGKMFRRKETLQQAPLNKRKESYCPGPSREDKLELRGCLVGGGNSGNISKKTVYFRRIGHVSGRRASAPFVPCIVNVHLCVLCLLNVKNVQVS